MSTLDEVKAASERFGSFMMKVKGASAKSISSSSDDQSDSFSDEPQKIAGWPSAIFFPPGSPHYAITICNGVTMYTVDLRSSLSTPCAFCMFILYPFCLFTLWSLAVLKQGCPKIRISLSGAEAAMTIPYSHRRRVTSTQSLRSQNLKNLQLLESLQYKKEPCMPDRMLLAQK